MVNFDKIKLGNDFKGKLIFPSDPDYDSARTVFYGGINRKPALIIQVADLNDIIGAIELAKTTGVELAVRSGGHSFAGYSVSDGGIVVDLKQKRKLEINTEDGTAWVETGLATGEVTNAADEHNLVVGFGDTGSVGVGGITLGGGIGFLVRKYGLTIDNLLAAEIVTADGSVLYIDSHNRPDLFWAIRGGGGNFGIITRFQYQLHPLKQAIGGMILLPAIPEIIADFITLAANAPEELSVIINIMPSPPLPFVPAEYHGKISIMALIMYAGEPGKGEKVIASIRALAKPIADMVKPMRYKDIFFPEDPSFHPLAVAQTMFMKSIDGKSAGLILDLLKESDAPMRVVQLRVLGGAMSRVPAEATAFAYRQSPILSNIAAFYDTEETKKKRLAWVRKLAGELYQGEDGAYIGFLGNEKEDLERTAYPEATWKRLMKIKNTYDPTNLFRLNYNIPPVRGER